MTQQFKARLFVLLIFVFAIFAAFFDGRFFVPKLSDRVPNFLKKNFTLGLDLQGGAHLLYQADTSKVNGDPREAMESLRDTIERRINIFGVSEPLVQVETKGGEYRLLVELAGIKDINEAIRMIGETPFLEFRELDGPIPKTEEEAQKVRFIPTGLDGRFLKRAEVVFEKTTGRPEISVVYNEDGEKLLAEVTKRNVQKPMGIFLDGMLLSQPIVQQEITGGKAQITGSFSVKEAKELVRYLNAGALPVPISLISRENVEASLGSVYLEKSLHAALYGFLGVLAFMVAWYRLPGILAVVALFSYAAFTLAIFKLIPVTLTTAGIAGFVLSVGMAVDANILVFERMKEELRAGREIKDAMLEGFRRAWTSIRDSNVSSLITSSILYWFGTSVVKGFALTLAIGILISMFTALTVTRNLLLGVLTRYLEKRKFLFLSGINKG